ncbi:MAG: DNA primase [Candidatus Eremiobacteraeota bacterium]|nr:DNA primase [Candidatus Eremiobacteraeota bacterium]MBV8365766.1 DNA primase [Candidatus Eremiobacteraeota bacterium]
MPFDAGVVAEVQAKSDLLAYVSQYVTLKRQGREYVGLCPFHSEKTPSFYLNAEKQVWHCHGCNAGGDLIKFVERYENVDFPTALRMLATRAGIILEESPGAQRRRSEREAVYEANAVAQAFFADHLRRDKKALDYVHRRGVVDETAALFGIGYAPDGWEGLAKALERSGVDLALAERAGLVRQKTGHYDFFRNRLMLPIYNLTGEVMAFGGRALGDETPKYLNTPNTVAYTKGAHVYALNLARKAAAADDTLIVVEGYLDAIALHQAGFKNAVASLGTSFTPEQARELRRVANKLYLCFDGDAAGQAATARSIDMLVDEGLAVSIVALPAGTDPDEFIMDNGRDAFAALINRAQRWVDFKIELACRRISSTFSSKSDIAREAMTVIAQVRDPIERDQYIKAMARRLDVSEAALRQTRVLPFNRQTARPADAPAIRRAPATAQPVSAERDALQLVLARPELLAEALATILPDDFEDVELRGVFERLREHARDLERGVNPLTVFADDPLVAELTRMALASPPLPLEDDERRLALIAQRFERRRDERRLSSIDEEINRLINSDRSVPQTLRDEYNALAASLRGPAGEHNRKEG